MAGLRFRGEMKLANCISKSVANDAACSRVAFGTMPKRTLQGCPRGKGVPGQSSVLLLRGRCCAPTSLALQAAPALVSRPLGAAQARRCLSGHAFAGCLVVRIARAEPSRQAVPAGGDLWSDEKHSPTVGARSALRGLTRRSCLSAVSEANAASSATRLWGEHRSAVGATRRPRKHEPPAGTAWRDAISLEPSANTTWSKYEALRKSGLRRTAITIGERANVTHGAFRCLPCAPSTVK